jgi:hypothetical protein
MPWDNKNLNAAPGLEEVGTAVYLPRWVAPEVPIVK